MGLGRFGFALLVLWSAGAWALEDGRLWLPKSYAEWMPQLRQSVSLAESGEECDEVVDGHLSLSRSRPDEPVFAIVCRRSSGETFAQFYQASASTVQVLHHDVASSVATRAVRPVPGMPFDKAWAICSEGLIEQSARMLNVVIHDQPRPTPTVTDQGETVFRIPFDAQNPAGEVLRFDAVCRVLPSGVKRLKFTARQGS